MNTLHSAVAHGTTPTREVQNDPIALAIVLAIIVIFAIVVLRKSILSKKQVNVSEAEVSEPQTVAPVTAPGSAGEMKLYNVEPRTAAMLMAIVADKLGKPVNELRFISVQEVE